MTRFFDTSALAKRYMSEPGTAMVRATLRAHTAVVARITYAELAAAVARASRMGAVSEWSRRVRVAWSANVRSSAKGFTTRRGRSSRCAFAMYPPNHLALLAREQCV